MTEKQFLGRCQQNYTNQLVKAFMDKRLGADNNNLTGSSSRCFQLANDFLQQHPSFKANIRDETGGNFNTASCLDLRASSIFSTWLQFIQNNHSLYPEAYNGLPQNLGGQTSGGGGWGYSLKLALTILSYL